MLGAQMHEWRNACSMQDLRERLAYMHAYSVAILGSGGLVDLVAAMRAGFLAVWGTEVCPKQQGLWDHMTNSPNYPDTFRDIPNNVYRPLYLKSGQPCPNYTCEGSTGGGRMRRRRLIGMDVLRAGECHSQNPALSLLPRDDR